MPARLGHESCAELHTLTVWEDAEDETVPPAAAKSDVAEPVLREIIGYPHYCELAAPVRLQPTIDILTI